MDLDQLDLQGRVAERRDAGGVLDMGRFEEVGAGNGDPSTTPLEVQRGVTGPPGAVPPVGREALAAGERSPSVGIVVWSAAALTEPWHGRVSARRTRG